MEGIKVLTEELKGKVTDLFPGATNALMGGLKDVGKVYDELATAASVADIIKFTVAIVVAQSMINRFLSRNAKPTITNRILDGFGTSISTIRDSTVPAFDMVKDGAGSLVYSAIARMEKKFFMLAWKIFDHWENFKSLI